MAAVRKEGKIKVSAKTCSEAVYVRACSLYAAHLAAHCADFIRAFNLPQKKVEMKSTQSLGTLQGFGGSFCPSFQFPNQQADGLGLVTALTA